MRGSGMRGGGGGRRGGYAEHIDDDERKLRKTSLRDFFGILKPYLLPHGSLPRLRAFCCFASLILSKLCNIYAPIWLGEATQKLIGLPRTLPVAGIVAYSLLRFGTSLGNELQRYVYLRVKEIAYRCVTE